VVAHFDAIPIREWNEIRLEVADRVLRSRTAG
jgi:hypothetical protein